jgi:hypothetical protein
MGMSRAMVDRPSWMILHASVRVSDRFESAFPAAPPLRHDVTTRQLCQCEPASRGGRTAHRTGSSPSSPRAAVAGPRLERMLDQRATVRSRGRGSGQWQRREGPAGDGVDRGAPVCRARRWSRINREEHAPINHRGPTRSLDRLANGPVSVVVLDHHARRAHWILLAMRLAIAAARWERSSSA